MKFLNQIINLPPTAYTVAEARQPLPILITILTIPFILICHAAIGWGWLISEVGRQVILGYAFGYTLLVVALVDLLWKNWEVMTC
jgi:hypothetical protein